ncbi:uncharacterized protein C8Q71DRAFT_178890 [Rhodofomes roseus]|uniref:Uncharacterized protein n=1 Tax=Rhodofomes roseus TaxID=34475 RepID=A0ABQ8K9S2_9APHY|nr:uncharacterized protein C8Q71DRAFT_178890 [Rhodofomes roseus]KAH9833862.1 hypothetical protein C8Q71DRAFT_178890 [Rhodofomes roseus]
MGSPGALYLSNAYVFSPMERRHCFTPTSDVVECSCKSTLCSARTADMGRYRDGRIFVPGLFDLSNNGSVLHSIRERIPRECQPQVSLTTLDKDRSHSRRQFVHSCSLKPSEDSSAAFRRLCQTVLVLHERRILAHMGTVPQPGQSTFLLPQRFRTDLTTSPLTMNHTRRRDSGIGLNVSVSDGQSRVDPVKLRAPEVGRSAARILHPR